jgi:hypothetical protein
MVRKADPAYPQPLADKATGCTINALYCCGTAVMRLSPAPLK